MEKEKIENVKLENIDMDYIVFGSGPKTLVQIPGMSVRRTINSSSAIANSWRKFADDYTFYVFDRKNNMAEEYSVEEMADDTAKVMKHLGLKDVYMMGNSQGGMIAMSLALKYPELVKKLLVGSSASRPNPVTTKVMEKWYEISKTGDVVALNHDAYQRFFTKKYLERYAGAISFLEKTGDADDVRRFGILAQATEKFDIYEKLPEIKAEMFVIGARLDEVLSVEGSIEIAEKKGCPIYIYEEYAHAVNDEAKDYKTKVMEFFNA